MPGTEYMGLGTPDGLTLGRLRRFLAAADREGASDELLVVTASPWHREHVVTQLLLMSETGSPRPAPCGPAAGGRLRCDGA